MKYVDDENDSEDEGIDDYKIGGYHPVHVGYLFYSNKSQFKERCY